MDNVIKKILEAAVRWLAVKTGVPVLLDPQPIQTAEPQLRLTYTGCSDQGGYDELGFQLSIIGAGDGPTTFLPKVISCSLAVMDLYSGSQSDGMAYVDIPVPDVQGRSFRITFPDVAGNTGVFVQNNPEDVERRQWAYVYTEPHTMTIRFRSALRRAQE